MVSAYPKEPDGVNLNEAMANLGIESSFGNDWLKVMTLKIMGDGLVAGGTAGVYEPQNRGPKGLGLMMTDPEAIGLRPGTGPTWPKKRTGWAASSRESWRI